MTFSRKFWGVLLLLALLSLPACKGTPKVESTPTPDVEMIKTSAAATVAANLTQTAIHQPTATETPAPTITPQPSPTVPLATATQAVTATKPVSPNQAEYIGQSVADGASFSAGQAFSMSWTLKNVGNTTWTTSYSLAFYSGDSLGAPNSVKLTKEVKPNESIEIVVPMVAPSAAGNYISNWVLRNHEGSNFFSVYLDIKVGNAPAATATTAIQPTATTESGGTPTP